ncbi:MAG: radical SAM protein [Chloroflexi bacterium]|nr:radical SAM protein [Chloroflexota bacterium]MCL5108113.1 radical SAM protein [Chloroflexota bacterium]
MLAVLRKLIEINGIGPVAGRIAVDLECYVRHTTPRRLLNLALVGLQTVRHDSNVRGYPYRFYVEPTNACNLRCPYCLGWQGRPHRPLGMMTLEQFRRVVDDVAPYAYWIDLYNRGEPTLNPALPEMIAYAHSKGIGTKLSSNFNLRDASLPERLVWSGLDQLVIAVDGATQETYSRYRVGGNLADVLENIRLAVNAKRLIRSRRPHILVRVLVNRYTEPELATIKRLVAGLGVDGVFFFPIFVDPTDKQAASEWLPENRKFSWYASDGRRLGTGQRYGAACPELWQRGTITWDGNIFPCCYIDDNRQTFGNVNDRPFTSVWQDDLYVASRTALGSRAAVEIETTCTRCRGALKRK